MDDTQKNFVMADGETFLRRTDETDEQLRERIQTNVAMRARSAMYKILGAPDPDMLKLRVMLDGREIACAQGDWFITKDAPMFKVLGKFSVEEK